MAATFNGIVCSSSTSPSLVGSGGLTRTHDNLERTRRLRHSSSSSSSFFYRTQVIHAHLLSISSFTSSVTSSNHKTRLQILACASPSDSQNTATNFTSSTKLYVSGLSFRTSEESLRNAFQSFGQLIEVNLVMDKIANRPRGFAFLRYATKEESEKAIEGMHGKFLDGRVIFVEFAKPRSQLNQGVKQDSKPTYQ